MSAISSVKTDVFRPYPAMGTACAVQNVRGPATEVELTAGDLWRMEGDNRWRMVVCRRGMIWITQECDLEDYVLTAGEMYVVTQPGKVLVQALDDACIEITSSARRSAYRGKYPVFK